MIHKTAIIDSKAKISSTVEIGPYAVIGPNVEINDECNNSITCKYNWIYNNWKKK